MKRGRKNRTIDSFDLDLLPAPDSSKRSSDHFKNSVKVGSKYQAVIPNLIPEGLQRNDESEDERLIWSPCCTIDDEKLADYVNETKEKFEYSQEQSLGILFANGYDLQKAREDVLKYEPRPVKWSIEDKALFEEGFNLHGKNFDMICKMLPDKPMKSVIEYYYSWKKTRHHTSLLDKRESYLHSRLMEGREKDVALQLKIKLLSLLLLRVIRLCLVELFAVPKISWKYYYKE
ncbi:REST corepressor [Trichonephila clavipes]|nr:REST corepressor [Trichonephila clavipes]